MSPSRSGVGRQGRGVVGNRLTSGKLFIGARKPMFACDSGAGRAELLQFEPRHLGHSYIEQQVAALSRVVVPAKVRSPTLGTSPFGVRAARVSKAVRDLHYPWCDLHPDCFNRTALAATPNYHCPTRSKARFWRRNR